MCKNLGGNIYECDNRDACAGSGGMWGTGIYTSDSNVFRAARHMGYLPGKFQKVDLPSMTQYFGTTHNGVTTANYGNYGASFCLLPIKQDKMVEESIKDILQKDFL